MAGARPHPRAGAAAGDARGQGDSGNRSGWHFLCVCIRSSLSSCKRAGTSLCTCLHTQNIARKAGPFAVARLKVGLPFHNRFAYSRVHRRSARPHARPLRILLVLAQIPVRVSSGPFLCADSTHGWAAVVCADDVRDGRGLRDHGPARTPSTANRHADLPPLASHPPSRLVSLVSFLSSPSSDVCRLLSLVSSLLYSSIPSAQHHPVCFT